MKFANKALFALLFLAAFWATKAADADNQNDQAPAEDVKDQDVAAQEKQPDDAQEKEDGQPEVPSEIPEDTPDDSAPVVLTRNPNYVVIKIDDPSFIDPDNFSELFRRYMEARSSRNFEYLRRPRWRFPIGWTENEVGYPTKK